MPFTLIQPHPRVAEAISHTLQEMATQKRFSIQSLAEAQPHQIDVTSAHPVYNIGLDDVLNRKRISQLPQTAWRFIVRAATTETAAVETPLAPDDGQVIAAVNSGPFVTGTIAALQGAAQHPSFAKGDWEGRMIRVPALFIMGVWAHEKASGEDLIRVIRPAPSYLTADKDYSWDDFLAAIEAPARQKLSFDDSPHR